LNVDQVDNARSLVLTPKKNLSQKQLEMHLFIILDSLTNKLTKNDFQNSSAICPNEDYDDLSCRYFEHICEILHSLYMLYDLPSMNKILTNFRYVINKKFNRNLIIYCCFFFINFHNRVLEIINKNRVQNINLWFKCLEFFKILKPLKFFELSLLNNLTTDLPHVMNLVETLRTSTIDNSSDFDASNSLIALETSDYLLHRNIDHNESNLQLEDDSLDEHFIINNTQTIVPNQKENYNYASLIDNLIDFKVRPSNEKQKSEKEPMNLVLLNRVILLNDLMLNLNERVFIKNYAMKLCELVNKVVLKVNLMFEKVNLQKLTRISLIKLIYNVF
jgi:hypothetical protein